MSYYKFEIYPKKEEELLYFIEFSQWNEESPLVWHLYKRNYFCSKEEWDKINDHLMMSREVHPYNLGGGNVCENPNVISMNTKEFLIFLVDSLNNYSKK